MNYLTLVNKESKIKNSYFEDLELIDYLDVLNEKIKVEKKALKSYMKLKDFLEKKGIYVLMDSSYRSIEEQQKIIDEFTSKYGKEYTDKYVAKPRTSEHHTGLAIDLCIKVDGRILIENEDLMAHEDIFLKIHPYLHKFGFILRYPKAKESITGYSYEPWHIRYVGEIPAAIIFKNQLTLEEYLKDFGGVLVVNKKKDMTSRDVVNKVSKLLGIRKIGHTGTLDPMAEGVLVLTIGKATKLGELLTSSSKEYIANVEIGKLTDTLDITGNIVKEKQVLKEIDYQKLIKSFCKTYNQEVPLYSAVKVNGKKLYEYARENRKVILPKKEVTIEDIELLKQNKDSFQFRCKVTKGTYIRSLIRDMGASIDEYFSMSDLVRTKQGKFSIDEAYSLSDIENNQFKILSIEEVLRKYPEVIMDEQLEKKVRNGCRISNCYQVKDKVLFKDKTGRVVAIYEVEDKNLKIYKMI